MADDGQLQSALDHTQKVLSVWAEHIPQFVCPRHCCWTHRTAEPLSVQACAEGSAL